MLHGRVQVVRVNSIRVWGAGGPGEEELARILGSPPGFHTQSFGF